jgi:UDP-glucose 4-epimerase
MKILVTGGAGFIASHVVDAYVKTGYKVVVIDNLSSGQRKNLNPKAKFYKADLRDEKTINRILAHEKPDVVNHHAAFISVTDSIKKPSETFNINVKGTLDLLLAYANSGKKGHRKFLFSSTGGAIYGNPKKLPADESTPPNPFSPYALSKQIDEEMIKYFCHANGIDYLIFRYANVYGPRQRAQGGAGIFPIFVSQIKKGITPTIFGNGKKTRDYVYVGDVAHASLLGATRVKNETINIATARETSDYQVFKAIADTLNFKKEPKFTPARKGEVQRITLSYKKAKRLLGWEPKMAFKDGVRAALRGL